MDMTVLTKILNLATNFLLSLGLLSIMAVSALSTIALSPRSYEKEMGINNKEESVFGTFNVNNQVQFTDDLDTKNSLFTPINKYFPNLRMRSFTSEDGFLAKIEVSEITNYQTNYKVLKIDNNKNLNKNFFVRLKSNPEDLVELMIKPTVNGTPASTKFAEGKAELPLTLKAFNSVEIGIQIIRLKNSTESYEFEVEVIEAE